MKSISKFIRRFVGILMLSTVLLAVLNAVFYAFVFVRNTSALSPWDLAEEAAGALRQADTGAAPPEDMAEPETAASHTADAEFFLPEDMAARLKEQDAWAVLIEEDTRKVIWQTGDLPDTIPMQYTLSDIAELTRGYVDGYPTFTGNARNGLLVLGFPRDRFWKHIRASWDYDFIANLPKNTVILLAVNTILIFLIYAAANSRLLRSIKPIANGIQDLSESRPVCIKENGLLSELAEQINKTSEILQKQAEQLRKKETARANWIAGVSHDIRTPLSMVMGCAGQLAASEALPEAQRNKAAVIVKQSSRMKDLINDLNLASRLEYDMQPLTVKQENAVAIVRQVVVDFMNLDIDGRFPIRWNTADTLTSCCINADRILLKRAVSNLIQNSINHNENGCVIYASVDADDTACRICIEDSGIGASDEQIDRLNHAPHYMACDTDTDGQRHGLGLLIVKQILNGHHGNVVIGRSGYGGFKVVLVLPK